MGARSFTGTSRRILHIFWWNFETFTTRRDIELLRTTSRTLAVGRVTYFRLISTEVRVRVTPRGDSEAVEGVHRGRSTQAADSEEAEGVGFYAST